LVDETIATDIDKIIQIIKKRKHMSLDALSKESGIPKDTLDKWLPMMEDVGLVTISYHLTQVFVDWKGGEEEFEGLEEITPAPQMIKGERLKEVPAENVNVVEEKIVLPEHKPNKISRVSQMFTRKTKPKQIKAKPKPEVKQVRFEEPEEKIPTKIELFKPPVAPPEGVRESKLTKKLRDKMRDMDNVRKELEQLKEQKRKLLEDVYKPMEQKFSVELKTISDSIAEKEQKILELQQRILQLPNTIDELDRQQLHMKEIEDETVKIAKDTSRAVNELLEKLSELKEETARQLESADHSVAEGNVQLGDMKSLMAKISSIRTELSNRISVMQKQIDEQTQRLEQLKNSWEKLEEIQSRTEERISSTEELLTKQEKIVDELEDKISRTEQLEQWLKMHQENYDKTFKEFLAYVQDNQKEFNRLRETLEANFVRRYLKDLEQLSEGYEFEMKKAHETEQSIDEKIEAAKNKLKSLLKQSRALVDAFEKAGYDKEEVTAPPEELLMEYNRKNKQMQTRMAQMIEERKNIVKRLKNKSSSEISQIPKSPSRKSSKASKPRKKSKKTGKKGKSKKNKK